MALVYDGETVTITTSGTAVQVRNSTDRVKAIIFKALPTNTGVVYVGRSDVEGAGGHSAVKGMPIAIGTEGHGISFGDGSVPMNVFWVDATANGDRVSYDVIYENGTV